MYLAGVSTRRVADITKALWDTRVSSATILKLNQSVYEHIEKWRSRPIEGEFPYVYLDGVSLKRRWGGEVGNVSVLIAIGVGVDGHRQQRVSGFGGEFGRFLSRSSVAALRCSFL